MPVYAVRWPDLSITLVQAPDEEELIEMLDEHADPGCAIWEEYEGPLWIDLETRIRYSDPPEGADRSLLEVTISDDIFGEEGVWYDVGNVSCTNPHGEDEVLAMMLPHIHQALEEAMELDEPEARELLREAAVAESWHMEAVWKRMDDAEKDPSLVGTILSNVQLTVLPPHLQGAVLGGLEQARENPERDVDAEIAQANALAVESRQWQAWLRQRLRSQRKLSRRDVLTDSPEGGAE